MDFLIHCECGKPTRVSEGSAGAKIPCPCGRAISVPALHILRERAGLSPYPGVSPEMVIERLLAAGRLPAEKTCAGCDVATDQIAVVRTECERARVGGSFSWFTLLLSFLFLPVLVFRWTRPQVYGQDRVYWLPLVLCEGCQRAAEDRNLLRRYMWRVPLYRELLEKYPSSSIELSGAREGL